MIFHDRADAANRLAQRLDAYRGKSPLILAIPRGAVPLGQIIAQQLRGDLDVVLVRKLAAPQNPEYAIGSIDESGWTYTAEGAERSGADAAYIRAATAREMQTLAARRALYTPHCAPIDPAGRIAIVVDDGLATGATMLAALHATRARQPLQLICAVPVAPPDTLARIQPHADRVICLETPVDFAAVSQFYQSFPQVDDSEVIAILREARASTARYEKNAPNG